VVVAVSSTAIARRGAPAQPALTEGETVRARRRAPRPWAAPLHRPAAKILLAGGLTLAGWLLTGALSGSTASAAETASCPDAPAVSTVDHRAGDHTTRDHTGKPSAHGKHHRGHHRETGAATCAQQPETGDEATKQPDETPVADTKTDHTQTDETPVVEKQTTAKQTTQSVQSTAVQSTAVQSAEEPTAEKPATKPASSGGGLLGGLVGGVLNVVGGTLNTVTSTVGALTTTLSHTVLAPLTQPPANNPDAPVVLPLDDILAPVLGTGGSNSGGVTATVPGLVDGTVTEVTTPAAGTGTVLVTTTAAAATQAGHVAVVHFIEVQHRLPATQEEPQPRDSGVHARDGGGGDTTPGLPGGTSAPSAPAPTAAPGHDGPGGARHSFAVHTDHATTTQLKLIGASLDHEVDGAGREAALPTTSPD
jgi:hypothetical protein